MQPLHNKTSEAPTALHNVAADNLRFIRATMEGASYFTGISGKGYVATGLSAAAAATFAAQQTTSQAWLAVWMAELVLACAISFAMTIHKSKAQGKTLWTGSGRRALLAFVPAMLVGGIFTGKLAWQGDVSLLPALWLALFGASVLAASQHSLRLLSYMGAAFIALASLVLLDWLPTNPALGLGFGGLHILFGVLIWRHHGG